MKERILIAGGSGYIGTHLTHHLEGNGYEVSWLGRKANASKERKVISWSHNKEVDEAILKHEVIINLCGASLGEKRWTKKYKDILISSRLEPTRVLAERVLYLSAKPTTFIQASAIGYYGTDGRSQAYIETDQKGNGFVAELCDQWERILAPLQEHSIPVAILRMAPVFNHGSAVFEKWASPFRYGLGAVVGSGKQFFPWIHIEDLCRIFLWLIEEKKTSLYNAVSPTTIQHHSVAKAMAHYFHKPICLPSLPAAIMKIIYGEAATLITEGDPVSSEKIQHEGFSFRYHQITDSMREMK